MKTSSQYRCYTLTKWLLLGLLFVSYSVFMPGCSKPKSDEKLIDAQVIEAPSLSDDIKTKIDNEPLNPDGQINVAAKTYEAPIKRVPIPRKYQTIRATKRSNPLLAYVPTSSFIVIASSAQLPLQGPQVDDFLAHIGQNAIELLKQWPKSELPQIRALQTLLSASLKSLSPHKLASLGLADGQLGDFVFYFANNMPIFKATLSDSQQFYKIFESYLKRENISSREDKINGITWQLIDLPKPYNGFLAIQWGQTLTVTLVVSEAQAKQQLSALSSPPQETANKSESRFANYLGRDDLFAFVSIDFNMFIDNFVGIVNQLRPFISYDSVTISPVCIKDLRFLASLVPALSIEISAFSGGPMLGFAAKCDVDIGEKTIRDRLFQMQGSRREMPTKTYLPTAQVYASLDMARIQQIIEHGKSLLRRQNVTCSGLTGINALLEFDEDTYPELESLWGERLDIGASIYEGSFLNPKQMAIFVEAEDAASIAIDMAWIEIPQNDDKERDQDLDASDETDPSIEANENAVLALETQENLLDYSKAKLGSRAIQMTRPKIPRQLRVRKTLVIASSHEELIDDIADAKKQPTDVLFEASISERGYIEDHDPTHDYHFDTKVEAVDKGIRFTLQYTLE